MSPLVLAPQTKKLPASTQKAGERVAHTRAERGARGRFSDAGPAPSVEARQPYGLRFRSAGRSRIKASTSINMSAAAPATIITALLHPELSTTRASIGRKTN